MAAGFEFNDGRQINPVKYLVRPLDSMSHADWTGWNPLTDDGDALRLLTKLGLSIQMDAQWSDGLYAVVTLNNVLEAAPLAGDRYAAVRFAIVRAAAEIGVLM